MVLPCYVEVEVDGDEVFWVDKKILSSYSGKLNKLFGKSSTTAETKSLKVILHGLPGSSQAFELIARFCYNQGKTEVTPANTCLLYCAAHFMEMTEDVQASPNLVKQTEKSLKGITYWSWSELLIALRQCQGQFSSEKTDDVFEKVIESVVGRIASTNETSPSNSSPESSGLRFSCDTRSTVSTKCSSHRAWWFEDIMFLNPDAIQKVVMMMVTRKMDHQAISRFLLYYLKSRTSGSHVTSDDKREVMEVVINLLYSLDRTCISYKGLFGILRMSLLMNLSICCRSRLDCMIGSQIDRATLDNILVPASVGMDSLYDVGLVLRFLKSFLSEGGQSSITRLKTVGSLMDLYLAEVAPDPSLKPQNFVSLAMVLPDEARDSYDTVYRAIDMYIEVHVCLTEEEKMRICCVLNYAKLSSDTCKHLAQNSKLPSRTAIQALVCQQTKLKGLLQDTNNYKFLQNSPCKGNDLNDSEPVILYAKKLDVTTVENEKLKAHLQGMQWRVMELEKICRKMQTQMTKIMKPGMSSCKNARSLPKLCS